MTTCVDGQKWPLKLIPMICHWLWWIRFHILREWFFSSHSTMVAPLPTPMTNLLGKEFGQTKTCTYRCFRVPAIDLLLVKPLQFLDGFLHRRGTRQGLIGGYNVCNVWKRTIQYTSCIHRFSYVYIYIYIIERERDKVIDSIFPPHLFVLFFKRYSVATWDVRCCLDSTKGAWEPNQPLRILQHATSQCATLL